MRKLVIISMLVGCMILDSCGSSINYDITNNAIAITIDDSREYTNPNDAEDTYQIVTIDSRDYILYGTQSKTITQDMVGECIAYDSDDNNVRYYKVVGNDDYIAEYIVNGEMEQFDFLRATDTIGKNINTPDFIDSFGYEIWK